MWDSSNDYRLKVTEKSVELFLRTMDRANLKGKWSKKPAVEAARKMVPEIQTLYYSYLSPSEMANAPQIDALEDNCQKIIEALGGDAWNRQFMAMAERSEREKLEEVLAKIKFFLNTVQGIRERLLLGEINDPIIGIDIKKGEILSVAKHPNAEKLLICNLNLGERAITVVTNDLTMKEGDEVAVAILPPETFMGITSEGMFLGTSEGVLKNVEGKMGKMPHGIPLNSLNEARNMVEAFLQG
ncbi:MAG TPA: tRNA-binding protein [Methanobacteriaceae archaeon]|nr:tRNA-binding protein [Methanobacteriaceae archaeon]